MCGPHTPAYGFEGVRQDATQKPSGLLVAQLLPCGVTRAKRGGYRTGTISPGLQLPATLAYGVCQTAVEAISMAPF